MGGSITYVHGMRVLNLVDEPTRKAIVPDNAPGEAGGREGLSESRRSGLEPTTSALQERCSTN